MRGHKMSQVTLEGMVTTTTKRTHYKFIHYETRNLLFDSSN